MSQIANITVFDGAGTPVSHTLTAIEVIRSADKTVALWKELLSTVPDEAQIRVTATKQRLKSGVTKCEMRVEVPTMESVAGNNSAGYTAAPKVAFVDTFVETFYAHPRSTPNSRRLTRQIGVNLSNNISTSVAAATTGPIPELFDQLISPT